MGEQFFKDMAWGGLHETNVFKSLPITDQTRIYQRIRAELKNENVGSTAPLGTSTCN
jgi:hypothetical protein